MITIIEFQDTWKKISLNHRYSAFIKDSIKTNFRNASEIFLKKLNVIGHHECLNIIRVLISQGWNALEKTGRLPNSICLGYTSTDKSGSDSDMGKAYAAPPDS
jgi:hypothetical protein